MTLIRFLSAICSVMLTLAPLEAFAQSLYEPKHQLIPAPTCFDFKDAWTDISRGMCGPQVHADWLKDISHWRDERRIRIGYNGWRHKEPSLKWTQSSFLQPQMMVQDRFFYDPVSGKYTVDRFLDDLEKRYGGIDAVLIWPSYPNMGIDDRNQQDMIRSMPGGIPGVKGMITDFHRRGVHVLFPMMMWDQGTRDPGKPWPQAVAELMKEIGADGANGDDQDGVPLAFSAAAEKLGHALAFEPEDSPSDEALAWNVMTWGQYEGEFTRVPGVDRFRWLEPRHMVHISDRWSRDKTDDLQYAFFNGEGWESWENVWGIWNGVTPRDGEAVRRMATLERGLAPFLTSEDWEPFYPMHQYGVFASRWGLRDATVWTIVNRNEFEVAGRQLSLRTAAGARYFDLYHGNELHAQREGQSDVLSFALEAHGLGAILAVRSGPDKPVQELMARMKAMSTLPLSSYAAEWTSLPQQVVAIQASKIAASAPKNMVRISGGDYIFRVHGLEIEGFNAVGVDVQYPWESSAHRFHEQRMHIKPFHIDKFLVTNAEFKRFLDATAYHPRDAQNFLHDWDTAAHTDEWAQRPVTWVSIEDAREYAKWAGKRLPHEWEWQFAAQGTDNRIYPWGNDWEPEAVQHIDTGRHLHFPDEVGLHPNGASPFGVMDLVGSIWQWTDEYVDAHTRAAILKGGSYYQPQGSMWYFPQAYRNDEHGKLLLMAPSYDRSGTIGFRCVVDAANPP